MSAIKPDLVVKNYTVRTDLGRESQPAKTKEFSAWAKPVVYTALGAAGVAAAFFILYQSFFSSTGPEVPTSTQSLFSPIPSLKDFDSNGTLLPESQSVVNLAQSSTAPTPSFIPTQIPTSVPTPTPVPSPTPSFVPTQIPTPVEDLISIGLAPTPTPVPASTPRFVRAEYFQTRGKELLKDWKWNPAGIDYSYLNNTLSEFSSQNDLLDHEARSLYHRCIEQIPTVLEGMEKADALDAAYLSSQMRSSCMSISRNAMKDQFFAKYILPLVDWFNHGTTNKGQFEYLVGIKGTNPFERLVGKGTNLIAISNAIIKSSQKTNEEVNWLAQGTGPVETGVVGLGQAVGRNVNERLGYEIARYPLSSPIAASGLTGVNLVMTPILAMMSSRVGLKSMLWTLPITMFGGYFAPHMYEVSPSRSDLSNGLSSLDSMSSGWLSFTWNVMTTSIFQLPNLLFSVDEHVSGGGKALGRQLGDNFVGNTVQESPKTTLAGAGTLAGLAYGSVNFRGNLKEAQKLATAAANAVLEPDSGPMPTIAQLRGWGPGGQPLRSAKDVRKNFLPTVNRLWTDELQAKKALTFNNEYWARVGGSYKRAVLNRIVKPAALAGLGTLAVAGVAHGTYSAYDYFTTPVATDGTDVG